MPSIAPLRSKAFGQLRPLAATLSRIPTPLNVEIMRLTDSLHV